MLPRRALSATVVAAAALAAAAFASSCGGDSGMNGPAFVNVHVTYVSRLPAGCPDIGNICYPGCAHHNAPAGLHAVVPLWGAETLRLTEAAPGRYEGVLLQVPTSTTLRLYGRDIGACCVDACNFPPVLEDISLNGTKLTKVVRDGLPVGVTAALEFSVSGAGAITPTP
jgi:hypothetical protein